MYGKCPVCQGSVQLIYLNPEDRKELVIGPHDAPLSAWSAGSIRPSMCEGKGRKLAGKSAVS